MVGRTPEYLGKKIQQKEVKMAMVAIIATAFVILVFTAVSIVAPFAKNGYWNPPGPAIANLTNSGPHGFSEMLYAYSSASENNGSAFAGLNVRTLPGTTSPWVWPWCSGASRSSSPLWPSPEAWSAKKRVPSSSGTFPTHGALFVGLLVGTVIVIGALTFFPALSLGPLVEHYLMHQGKLFSSLMFSIWS